MGREDQQQRWRADERALVAEPFATVWEHLVREDPQPEPADAIFCFGSRHWRVPERAASLYHDGVAPLVLVTGAAPAPGEPTEALRFAEALESLGVPVEAIVTEHMASNTGDNVRLGLAALAEVTSPERLVLVCWPLAALRCLTTLSAQAPEVDAVCAPALRRPRWRWHPTPKRARLALGELDRLDRYAAEGHVAYGGTPSEVLLAAGRLREALEGAAIGDASTADPALGDDEAAWAVLEAEEPALVGR